MLLINYFIGFVELKDEDENGIQRRDWIIGMGNAQEIDDGELSKL